MSAIGQNMRRVSNRLTRQIALRWGETFPMYVVSEYPKSGGTWLGRMVADCLEIPLPRHTNLPLAMTCVVHNHWGYDPRLRRCIYLYRDGRDVMVSFYFHRMRWIHNERNPKYAGHAQKYEAMFGKGYDKDDTVANLARFIEHEFANPRDSRLTWRQHVESWGAPDGHEHVAYVSYEQLREDCAGHLKRIVEHVAGRPIEDWRVDMAVDKFSMQRATGRKPGEEDRTTLIRKGVVGDWVNHFSREAAEVFDRLAGDTLVRLGYEADRGWVSRYELPG